MYASLTTPIGKIFQPLLDAVGGVLAFFFSIVPNYPIDVALLTIVIMAILTPLTVKSTKNMAAMQALGPEMKKLQQKYKGAENRAQLNEEMMKLYKEHKVNPASGCLPMLLQMPAFFVLYSVIRGITNTVSKGTVLNTGKVCAEKVCADPRYIPQHSKMYADIVVAGGQLNSFGMNFADKLLSHHSSIWVAIPYLLLVIASVGLQYLQMSRLNARNPQAAKSNPQAAMMQKYMPLIFGFIYLNVAAILNVYFIFSSAIRIGTQEVLFRKGLAGGPPTAPTATSGKPGTKAAVADRTERALPKSKSANAASGNGKAGTPSKPTAAGKSTGAKKTTPGTKAPVKKSTSAGKAGGTAAGTNGAKRPAATNGKAGGGTAKASTNGSNGASADEDSDDASGAKQHPRSKAKRERKAR